MATQPMLELTEDQAGSRRQGTELKSDDNNPQLLAKILRGPQIKRPHYILRRHKNVMPATAIKAQEQLQQLDNKAPPQQSLNASPLERATLKIRLGLQTAFVYKIDSGGKISRLDQTWEKWAFKWQHGGWACEYEC